MPKRPRLESPPPDTGEALRITTTFPGARNKRTTPPQAIRHDAAAPLQNDLNGYLHLFTDGSMKYSTGEAAAACVVPEEPAKELPPVLPRLFHTGGAGRTAPGGLPPPREGAPRPHRVGHPHGLQASPATAARGLPAHQQQQLPGALSCG